MKYKIIDLFSGAGGLLEGFLQTNLYIPLASVEWEKAPVETLRNRLLHHYNIEDANESVIHFDMQRYNELFIGFDDEKYGKSKGLDYYLKEGVDVVIGGPPCQAYSQAGRTKDKYGMRYDYRNYLFEYYLKVVSRYQPDFFIFENVPGMLSAMPDGTPIIDLIRNDVEKIGFEIIDDIKKYALINTSDYGVPQNRKRVILLGINKKKYFDKDIQNILKTFYKNILPKYKSDKVLTVWDAIGDLEKLFPMDNPKPRQSHLMPKQTPKDWWHTPRYHNERDIQIFKMLAYDIESNKNELQNAKSLNDIYNQATGGNSKVHKYHVLRKDKPSTTITAHLHKDGLRFIHPDSDQARSITVREAARLQSFPDDFQFISTMGNNYKMIGNAVPPKFAKCLALSLYDLLSILK